jgi:ABC-type branched-subunit amino acid transport system substrate-binding protein
MRATHPLNLKKFMHHQNPLSVFARKLGALMLFGCAVAASSVMAEPGVSADSITLGQSTSLTGPLGDLGQDVLKGAKVYFDALNAKGGVNGRSIKLVTKDDAYDSKKTVENIEAFIAADATFALFGTFGTPNNEALLPIARKAGLPVLTPYSGAPSIRGKSISGVFNLRASYADEVDRLVDHLNTVGIKKIAVAYQNNAFGKEVLESIVATMERYKLKPLLAASVESSASDAPAVAGKLLESQPEAVLLALAGKPAVEVIKNVNQRRRGMSMYALSVLATPSNLRALGSDGTGVAITQVVPYPLNTSLAVVREYQQAMTAAGQTDFSHLSLEGYINAKLVTEGIRRAGRTPTRSGLVSALDTMSNYNLGGLTVSFGQGASSGSRFVELTMVNAQGKLIK